MTTLTLKHSLSDEQICNLWRRHHNTIKINNSKYDLSNENEFKAHSKLIYGIGSNFADREFRRFEIDENNRLILRFLLYYFNGCELAHSVFPDRGYSVHKNLLFVGEAGTGKTMLMQIFADYLRLTQSKKAFQNISITQLMNTYKLRGNIDKYTFNELESKNYEGSPMHVCLNDIGLETENQKSYGTALDTVLDEFLYARYEIYQNSLTNYHLTSNLTADEFKARFGYRLVDRFKSFNIIPLSGASRRK